MKGIFKYFFLLFFSLVSTVGFGQCHPSYPACNGSGELKNRECGTTYTPTTTFQTTCNTASYDGDYIEFNLTAGKTYYFTNSETRVGAHSCDYMSFFLHNPSNSCVEYAYTNVTACMYYEVPVGQGGIYKLRLQQDPCIDNTCTSRIGYQEVASGTSQYYAPVPSGLTSSNGTTLCSGSTTLSGSNLGGNSVWYTGSCGGTQVGTGSSITVSPASTTTYWVRNSYTTNCDGSSSLSWTTCTSITITVATAPAITAHPSTSNVSTCQNGTAFSALSVTASGTPLNYQWYSNSSNSNSGGTLISGATSNTYTPPNTSTGTTYYYCIVSNSCGTVTSNVSGSQTVNSNPSAPATPTTNSPNCTNVTLTGNPPTASWYWQGTNSSGTSTANPTTSTYSAGSTGTYYVRAYNGSCWSSATSVDVTIKSNSNAPTGASASSGTICSGGSSTLSVSGGSLGTGGSWKWYTGSCGGSLVGTGSSISVSPSTTTTYYVRAEGDCNNTTCQSVTVTVDAGVGPTAPSITGTASFCIGSNVTLTPNFPTGGSITNSGGFNYHVFNSNGTFTPPQSWRTESIIVAGGGGGGTNGGGGGGAGGVIYNSNDVVPSGANAVVVGSGGASNSPGTNGGNSSFDGVSAIGGGGGASRDAGAGGQNGGSGGGGGGTSEAGSGSASATFSSGNMNTQFVSSPTTANNSICPTDLSVTIPASATITSVNVSYSIEALGVGYKSDQRSYVQCTSTGGTKESSTSSGTGNSTGIQPYSRTGLTIANGVSGGGTISFRLHAFRIYEGTAGCNATVNRVNNNTFTVTVNYTMPSPTRSVAGSGTAGQGSNGGNGTAPDQSCNSAGGGGGGASGVGAAAANNVGGAGGAGVQYSEFSAVSAVANGWFGGGGGGGGTNFVGCGGGGTNPTMGAGGTGGGGTGETSDGVANSGGGGGAERSGGSGVVIIKYPTGTWSSNNTSVATVNSSGVVTGESAGNATITYTVVGSTGCSNSSTITVTVNPLPSAAEVITGTATICQGQTGVNYSVPTITNSTGYTWTLPSGASITAGSNTNSITVSFSSSATSGNITVQGTNSCGNGTVSGNYSVTVNQPPSIISISPP